MDDAAFKRDRLQAAVTKLGERLQQLKDQEENERRQLAYDKATAERDNLAAELADLYPAVAQKLAELLARVAANDREVDYINKHALPKGAGRLLEVELIAREMPGWVQAGVQTPRIAVPAALASSVALSLATGNEIGARRRTRTIQMADHEYTVRLVDVRLAPTSGAKDGVIGLPACG
jgi:hypothetical protein